MTVQRNEQLGFVEPKKKIKPSAKRQDTSAAKRGVVVTRAADLKPQKLARVWNGRFFLGKVGLIAGEPGLGKSQISIHMAATVSTGGDWPRGEGSARRGDVIYISAEDRAADTIRPRLEAAGADLKRVHIVEAVNDALGTRPFNLLTDLGPLDEILQTLRKPRLVNIDPINACLSSTDVHRFNPNSVTHVRALLGRLESLAAKHRVAIVGVTHFTKAKGRSTLARVTGSFAFVAAVPSVFTVERKQDDPSQRVFAAAKNNLTADNVPLVFRIQQGLGEIPAPYVVFASS
jgi:predicted ATP-dependent serine protease